MSVLLSLKMEMGAQRTQLEGQMRTTVQNDSITKSPARKGNIDLEKVSQVKTPNDIKKIVSNAEKLTVNDAKLKGAKLMGTKLEDEPKGATLKGAKLRKSS